MHSAPSVHETFESCHVRFFIFIFFYLQAINTKPADDVTVVGNRKEATIFV